MALRKAQILGIVVAALAIQLGRALPTPLAPLPHADLTAVLVQDFGEARTLPAAAYLSDAVLSWERRHLFEASWVCVGRSDLLPEPKSQRGIRLGGEGIVLARAEDGVL